MGEILNLSATGMEGQRIDKALAVLQPDMSRSYIQKMIKDGKVFVNQKVIKANYKLEATDEITVHVPEPVKLDGFRHTV